MSCPSQGLPAALRGQPGPPGRHPNPTSSLTHSRPASCWPPLPQVSHRPAQASNLTRCSISLKPGLITEISWWGFLSARRPLD